MEAVVDGLQSPYSSLLTNTLLSLPFPCSFFLRFDEQKKKEKTKNGKHGDGVQQGELKEEEEEKSAD